jgi:hypothetical protein
MNPDEYVGLDAAAAEARARANGWRVIRSLGPGDAMTMEYMPARLNFVVVDEIVRRCRQG